MGHLKQKISMFEENLIKEASLLDSLKPSATLLDQAAS